MITFSIIVNGFRYTVTKQGTGQYLVDMPGDNISAKIGCKSDERARYELLLHVVRTAGYKIEKDLDFRSTARAKVNQK